MFETNHLGKLVIDKKYIETKGCANCDNSYPIEGIDMYIPKDKRICEARDCEYLEDFSESKTDFNAILLMNVLDRYYES